jgi:LmbE family N-acetylglucosaminyl deacetylase
VRILYVFPHPDDESFGPARAMAGQRRQGHEVYLLTLTRGEATKVRHKFGWSLEEMGAARHREMQGVKATLELADMRILNLPDGQLKELDPWRVENAIREEMLRVKPHVVVTFPIHGISGFHDHIVTHAAVTRVYLELRGPEPTVDGPLLWAAGSLTRCDRVTLEFMVDPGPPPGIRCLIGCWIPSG